MRCKYSKWKTLMSLFSMDTNFMTEKEEGFTKGSSSMKELKKCWEGLDNCKCKKKLLMKHWMMK